MEPILVADYQCHTGENPIWHPYERCVYWTDIPRGKLFRFDPATGEHDQVYSGAQVGGFTIQENGSLLLFMEKGAIAIWHGGELNYIMKGLSEERESRFNDVIADPAGHVFCGTMPTPQRLGRLYRLDIDGSLQTILEGVNISNGMGFTPDRNGMYYTESGTRTIYLFDYDEGTGALGNKRVWLQTPEESGVPDGLTVDGGGYIWSARWDGSAVYRYTPDGEVDRQIELPAKKVTSVAFGGDDMSDLYITTALVNGTKEEEGVGAGGLFRVSTGIKGTPEYFSRILL